MKKRNIIAFAISGILFICSGTYVLAKSDPIENSQTPQAIEQQISEKKLFSLSQIDALVDKGYTYDEIKEMSKEQVEQVLTENLNTDELTKYKDSLKTDLRMGITALTATAPSGYTCVTTVPDGGGTNEWFESSVGTTNSTISTIVTDAKDGARKVFKSTASYPDIRYSYYLCGEWGEDPGYESWCHEGVDLKNTVSSTASVYSPISGIVSYSSTSGKTVNIYNATLGITMNFQHLNNVDGTGALLEGKTVTAGQFLGNQNTTDGHVHIQTCKHAKCTSVHSGRDLTLNCVKPYAYIK